VKLLLIACAITSGGCAQLLGLDDTKLEYRDAGIDAPSVCDGAPLCTSTTGRSVCGQLRGTGALAGEPLRVAAPTGEPCAAANKEGPCGFTVAGMAKASYFTGSRAGAVTGGIDDCGRFFVPDIAPGVADVAVVFDTMLPGIKQAATIVAKREAVVGIDRDIEAFVVSEATVSGWETQLSAGTPPDASTGFLIRYRRMDGSPLAGEQVASNGSSALGNAPGIVPWAAYFSGGAGFGTLDATHTATDATGTAIGVLGGATLSVDGFRTGIRCKVDGVQQMPNVLIFVSPPNC
jgi:hypothetical protein